MKIIDISLPITPEMPIYPGTKPTQFEPTKSASGSSFLTTITMTTHAGTHIDAPSHVTEGAPSIESFDLEKFYGPCRVLDMSDQQAVTKEALQAKNIQAGERILLKTQNSVRGFDKFYDQWVGMASDGAIYLAEIGIELVGIDWLGIKQKDAPDNTTHTALLEKGIPILEGLDLSKAVEGSYTLCAFPLAYKGIDGAQARAILITT